MPSQIRDICIISEGYPTEKRPFFTFVDQLVCEFADQGVQCTVVAPQSLTHCIVRGESVNPTYRKRLTQKGNTIDVYQPLTATISNFKVLNFSPNKFLFKLAVERGIRQLRNKPSVLYGHFWHSGFAVYPYAKKHAVPLFVATGEERILIKHNSRLIDDFSDYVKGVICVSSKNKMESISLGLTKEEKCVVLPNSLDTHKFYKKDRNACREKLGYKKDDFIVAFVGGFIHRKGSKRVADAITFLGDSTVKSIFIGDILGSDQAVPDCKGILYKGRVPHNEIIDYLNSADVFALPTLSEGCCNAIIEAMACGLPIISSNLPFNDDILTDENSIRIDPNSVPEIAETIKKLKNNPVLREKMGEKSLQIAENLRIENRARSIINFINAKLA